MGGELASPEFRFAAKIAPRLGELGVHSLITYDNLLLSDVIIIAKYCDVDRNCVCVRNKPQKALFLWSRLFVVVDGQMPQTTNFPTGASHYARCADIDLVRGGYWRAISRVDARVMRLTSN